MALTAKLLAMVPRTSTPAASSGTWSAEPLYKQLHTTFYTLGRNAIGDGKHAQKFTGESIFFSLGLVLNLVASNNKGINNNAKAQYNHRDSEEEFTL